MNIHTLRAATKSVRVTPRFTRSFYSPFVALRDKTPTSAPSTAYTSTSTVDHGDLWAADSQNDRKVYVVCEPHPSDRPYHVPAGAYPTSTPYTSLALADAPASTPVSSTSSSVTPRADPACTTQQA